MATSDPDPRIGHVIEGRYRILERLAQGGMGVVYRAERIPVGKTVAVKFLHSIYADDKPSLARFERETRVLSKLTHPNCVSVIDFGVDDSPYLVMDFAGGITLRAALDEAKIPLADCVAIVRQVLAGLGHAHSHGVVHRDIKPANIMISDEIGTGRHVRLLDFGLARLASSSNLTQSSVAIGTPSYMAPEQTVGGEVDVRTDIYQVGVVMFEMVTGERLFVAEDTSSLLEMHRSARVPRIAEVAPNVESKPGLDEVLQRALAKAPADRWQSAMELSSALDDVMAGRWRKPRTRGRRAIAIASVLALAGASYAGVTYWRTLAPDASSQSIQSIDAGFATLRSSDDANSAIDAVATVTPDAGHDAQADASADAVTAMATDVSDAGLAGGSTAQQVAVDAGQLLDGASVAADASADDASARDAVATDPGIVLTEEVATADPEATVPSHDATGEPSAPPPPRPSIPLAKTWSGVNALIKQGQRELAISSLLMMWKKNPKDGRLPYLLGNLYFDKRWWSDGMQHYSAAIRRAPGYRGNTILIRNVVSAIGDPRTRGNATFLLTKVIGPGAKGHLRTAAKNHADLSVRKAAQSLLKRW